jgi:hypothetical protein
VKAVPTKEEDEVLERFGMTGPGPVTIEARPNPMNATIWGVTFSRDHYPERHWDIKSAADLAKELRRATAGSTIAALIDAEVAKAVEKTRSRFE